MDDLLAFLNGRQNDKASDAIRRAVEVLLWPHEDRDSVRSPGWYVAQCDSCDWHTSGDEPVVEDSCREHIVEKHSPRELAEVDATRKIVGWCAEVIGKRDLSRYGEFGLLKDDPDALAVTFAVETLRLLALPDNRHPEYRAEWRP